MKKTSTNKIIVVNATAIISGGALSILHQFITHIADFHTYYIFVHPLLNLPVENNNIHFIKENVNTVFKRILWDSFGLKRWLKKRGIVPHILLSLQNTSIFYDRTIPKIIYLHQSLPLHQKRWSFFKKRERIFAFYKYIYPLFIFLHVDRNTKFVVQTEWMKTALCRRFFQNEESVHVIKPDIIRKDIASIAVKELLYQNTLFYPATSASFKNHREIILALHEIKKLSQDITHTGLYLTINEEDDKELTALINSLDLENNVQFLGSISYEEVVSYYKSCSTVVYPSYIESFGLPLLEAALFGKPLVAINESYAREVVADYPGVIFVPQNSPEAWMKAILQSFTNKEYASYLPAYKSGWKDFFQLVYEEMESEKGVLDNIN